MAGALTASIASIFSGSAVSTDPYFNLTTLLLSTTATNGQQNNTFQDSSTNNFTITRNPATGPNAPTQGTFSPFSQTGWSNYFDGTGDYLTIPDNAAFDLAAGDFLIEAWAYSQSSSNFKMIMGQWGTSNISYTLRQNAGKWVFTYTTNNSTEVAVNGTSNQVLNAWTHLAVIRTGNTLGLFVNGTRETTASMTGVTIYNNTGVFSVGGGGNGSDLWVGYIGQSRLVKTTIPSGYDATLTTCPVPTAPFSPTATTSVIVCQSNRFIDNSTNNFTITVNGNTTVVPFSPFNPTSAWSASTVGGSGYLVYASANYLSTTVTVSDFYTALGDFTFEGWVYPLSFSGPQYSCPLFSFTNDDLMLRAIPTSASSTSLNIYGINSAGGFAFGSSGTSGGTIKLNEWAWVVFTRESGVLNLWVNGARVVNSSAYTSTQLRQTATAIRLGGGFAGTNPYWNGYLSGLKWTSGAALYSGATISMPTAPPTTTVSAGTNRLLLNFTNSGIYDATAKNVLETVGNAQVSTTQSKWSPTSMYFDGTGDYLLLPDNPYQRIGTGNFTVECWVYRNSSGTYGLIGKGTGTTGWLLSLNSSNQVVFTYGSSTITSTGTVSATTWTHIAVVRSGTSTNQTKIYISGTNDGTGTVSTDFNQTNVMYVAADRTAGSNANAYVQDARVTRYARYTANFTPPTAAFPVQ